MVCIVTGWNLGRVSRFGSGQYFALHFSSFPKVAVSSVFVYARTPRSLPGIFSTFELETLKLLGLFWTPGKLQHLCFEGLFCNFAGAASFVPYPF